jgi:hypothetical protein
VLAIVCALLVALLLSVGLIIMSEEGYEFFATDIEDVLYAFVWCGLIVTGGILILLRRYKIGGAIALGFTVLLIIFALDIWFVSMWGIIGGALGLVSKEKIRETVLGVARRCGRVSIREVATETGKTEADVELAIIELESKGQPIRFDTGT